MSGDNSLNNSNFVIRLKSRDLSLPLKIRNMKSGDKMQVKNMNGRKKISDIFNGVGISCEVHTKSNADGICMLT